MLSSSQVNHNRGRVLDLSQSIQQQIQKEQKIGQVSQRERSLEEVECDGFSQQSFSPQKCYSLIKRFNKKPKDSENAYLKYLQNTIKEVGAKNNQHFLLKSSESAAQLTTCLDPPRQSIGASPQIRTININLLSMKEDYQQQTHKERSCSAGKNSINNSIVNKSKQHANIIQSKEEQIKKSKDSKLFNNINESKLNKKQTKEYVTNQSCQQELVQSSHQRNGQSPRIHLNDKSKSKILILQKNTQRVPSKESKQQHNIMNKIPTSADKLGFQNSPREIIQSQQYNSTFQQVKVANISNPFIIACQQTFNAKQLPDQSQNNQKINGTPQINSSKTSNASQSTIVNSPQILTQKNSDLGQTTFVKNITQSQGLSSFKSADIAVSQFCLIDEISVRSQIPKSLGHSKSGSTEVDSLQSSAVRNVNPSNTGLTKTNTKKVLQNQNVPMKVGKKGSAHFSSDVSVNFSLVIPPNNLINLDKKNDKEGPLKLNQLVKRINQDLQLNNSKINLASSPRKVHQMPLETSVNKDKKVNYVISERDRSQTQTLSKDEDKYIVTMNRSSSKSILQNKNKAIVVPLSKLSKNFSLNNQGQQSSGQETLNSSANLGISTMVPSKNSQFHFQPSYFTPLDHDTIKNYLQSQIQVNKSAIDYLDMPVKQQNCISSQPIQEINTKSLNISQSTLENVSSSQGLQSRLRADSNKQILVASKKQSEINTPVNKTADIPNVINSFRERF